jgi:hypothetical protein
MQYAARYEELKSTDFKLHARLKFPEPTEYEDRYRAFLPPLSDEWDSGTEECATPDSSATGTPAPGHGLLSSSTLKRPRSGDATLPPVAQQRRRGSSSGGPGMMSHALASVADRLGFETLSPSVGTTPAPSVGTTPAFLAPPLLGLGDTRVTSAWGSRLAGDRATASEPGPSTLPVGAQAARAPVRQGLDFAGGTGGVRASSDSGCGLTVAAVEWPPTGTGSARSVDWISPSVGVTPTSVPPASGGGPVAHNAFMMSAPDSPPVHPLAGPSFSGSHAPSTGSTPPRGGDPNPFVIPAPVGAHPSLAEYAAAWVSPAEDRAVQGGLHRWPRSEAPRSGSRIRLGATSTAQGPRGVTDMAWAGGQNYAPASAGDDWGFTDGQDSAADLGFVTSRSAPQAASASASAPASAPAPAGGSLVDYSHYLAGLDPSWLLDD